MKKFLILFVSCLILTSCKSDIDVNETDIKGPHRRKVYAHETMYKGHSYIEFHDSGVHGQGWVHNPDCECHNN